MCWDADFRRKIIIDASSYKIMLIFAFLFVYKNNVMRCLELINRKDY
jgi:hypothetical protein